MKRYIWSLAAAAVIAACMQGTAAAQDNMLTEAEQEAGWKLLFDGQTLLGWTHRGGTAIWAVEDGMLTGEATGGPGYIGSYDEFTNFELSVQFNQDAGHNSGVFVRGPHDTGARVNQYSFYEINIADTHGSGYTTGSIVALAKYEPPPKTEGQWNTMVITADGRDITVMLNGEEAVKIQDSSHYSGVVVLQAFGQGKIRFKNVKIRSLD
ncbi:MAG: DUF1080 domain-containing protein [Gemmatimonadetes bacterium]|nr:DUF1080 domain-containing protein [Gemmatimonadota bacterium]MYD25887.1 DUF1080 domain-containing protein [Gemmatimonadota bacterium]MYI99883.1 DUF1080 domain-containing protein [Gemmatimonadota bacterium]